MNDRLKELRKSLRLTQQEFADRLGLKRNTIATYEIGKSIPSDRTISDICREFNANELWIRTGDGEMLKPVTREDEIADLSTDLFRNNDSFKAKLILSIAKLNEDEINVLEGIARQLLSEYKESEQN